AADEIELMLTAFGAKRPPILDRVRGGQFREELREQMRLGLRPVQELVGDEDNLVEEQPLRTDHELARALVGLRDLPCGIGYQLFGCKILQSGEFAQHDLLTGPWDFPVPAYDHGPDAP